MHPVDVFKLSCSSVAIAEGLKRGSGSWADLLSLSGGVHAQ
jgi:hypothetical protein